MGDPKEVDRRLHGTSPDTKPSGIPGVSLRFQRGFHPRIPKSEVAALLPDARAFKQAHALAKLHGDARDTLRRRLAPKFRRHRGWTGIVSEADDLKLRVDEERRVVYNASLLRESMSPRQYGEVVPKEVMVFEFVLPRGVHPDVAIIEMAQAAEEIGARAAESLRVEIKPDVDEEALARGIRSDTIRLKRGARRVKRITKLTPESLVRNRPKTAAETTILKPGVEAQISPQELVAAETARPFQILADDPHVIVLDDDGDRD